MKNKKRQKIIISVLLVLAIGIGVKNYMDYGKREEVKKTEEYIAKKIISEYKGVKKIEFKDIVRNSNTGYSQITISVNNSKDFGYKVSIGTPDNGWYASSLEYFEKTPLKEKNARKKKLSMKEIDLNNYKVIYQLKISSDFFPHKVWRVPVGETSKDKEFYRLDDSGSVGD